MEKFGTTVRGEGVMLWRLGGGGGIEAGIINFGARLAWLTVPGGGPGGRVNVVLGLPDVAGYEADRAYLGATVGRFAGRIEGARFSLDGQEYPLPANDGTSCLHGGPVGFDRALWWGEMDGAALVLRHRSPAGDQGFPGTLDVEVRYTVRDGCGLEIHYRAHSDAPTVLNLTNHSYFNLNGGGDVLDHLLTIPADHFIPVGEGLVQGGAARAVAGTPFDFRLARRIGEGIGVADPQLHIAGGYDHSYLLAPTGTLEMRFAAQLIAGGIMMDVFSDAPCVQLYTANSLAGNRHGGVCLEMQAVPNSPNRPERGLVVLRPGVAFRSTTIYRFLG